MMEEGPCASPSLDSSSGQISILKSAPLSCRDHSPSRPVSPFTSLPANKALFFPSRLQIFSTSWLIMFRWGESGSRNSVYMCRYMCACARARPPSALESAPGMLPQQERTEDPRPQPPCPDRLSVMSAALGFVQSTSVLILTQEFHFRTVMASSGNASQAGYGLPRACPSPALPPHSPFQPQPNPWSNQYDSYLHCTSYVSSDSHTLFPPSRAMSEILPLNEKGYSLLSASQKPSFNPHHNPPEQSLPSTFTDGIEKAPTSP